MTWRNALYTFLKYSNDVRAIQRGRVGPRIWNRLIGAFARGFMR